MPLSLQHAREEVEIIVPQYRVLRVQSPEKEEQEDSQNNDVPWNTLHCLSVTELFPVRSPQRSTIASSPPYTIRLTPPSPPRPGPPPRVSPLALSFSPFLFFF